VKNDNIQEIRIDESGRLCITPEKENFAYIYRTAMEVHWDEKGLFLYSPKPREWSYFDWYVQILAAAKDGSCQLYLTDKTFWVNIPASLKEQILRHVHS
jgi:hypothetical protein